ncbi:putative hydrolase of the HAD superfamily [Allopseudospirillum japonicum]|uniref:Putative hydrolase of the HAD superfamily n=1 Tax=Allopseudospirillum japonicum TaxID=64971 RepID=A0A1H6UEL1_9GAMM|nr:HAD family hydrolase [Allopseudospirillum japonicum]SEI86595.1 putative hydrolase of the HAD superfamily [Allopseudospirillum japonicum]
MILVFDLDDTLYEERTYVESGLKAVADYGESAFGWDARASFYFMLDILNKEGRGRIFNLWLAHHHKESCTLVSKCVRIYRHHLPSLSLSNDAKNLLPKLANQYPLYLVTDGHKVVQQIKIEALNIQPWFRKTMITHRYGLKHAKPSTYCFEIIKKRETCTWQQMVYIGDNPAKDFVNLNPLGVTTVRIHRGMYCQQVAKPGYDARFHIETLDSLTEVLNVNLD